MIPVKLCFVQPLREPQPRWWHPEEMTVGFDSGSSLRLNPPVTYGDSPPNSGALGREITFDGRGEQQQTTMYNRKVSGFARGSPTRGAGAERLRGLTYKKSPDSVWNREIFSALIFTMHDHRRR